MNLKRNVLKFFTGFFLSFLLLGSLSQTSKVSAETLCPSNLDPDSIECLDYLRDALSDINKTQGKLESQLNNEQYQQLSLQEKISYITNQVTQTEKVIQSLQLEIAAQDIEINMLEDEIKTKEDSIAVMKQEISQLEDLVDRRVMESYKYSFFGPFELFVDSNSFSNLLRKTKYMLATRENDKEFLEDYSEEVKTLAKEEEELSVHRAELQLKRNSIEEEKTQLISEKKTLDAQKAEKASLLAESERKERELLATLEANRNLQAQLDVAIMQYIQDHGESMANYGWVNQGTWIGRMGGLANGCSTGPHLHFSIDSTSTSYWNGWGAVDPFSNGYLIKSDKYAWISASGWKYYYIYGNSMTLPLAGSVIVTQYPHYYSGITRYAIDLYSMNGYGAPVYAAMSGTLWKGTDSCGDTYAVIENSTTKLRTAYFHLQ